MLKGRFFLIFSVLVFCSLSVRAQGPLDSDRLFSPSVGQKFYEIAYEMANSEVADSNSVERIEKETLYSNRYTPNAINEQAIVFLTAAMNLDGRANYVLPDMLRCIVKRQAYLEADKKQQMRDTLLNLLSGYVDESSNLEVVTEAVRCLLEQLDSREQREQLLEELLRILGGKSAFLRSDLTTLLGLLAAEKADPNASSYFMQAVNSNKYNKLAFAKLAELVPDQIEPAMYAEHLRLSLGENPLDIEAALAFAQYAEKQQLYQTAADGYSYTADLFSYLYPSELLPASIYLPWALSNYNTQRNQYKCLEIASQFRQSGRFNLLLESIAGKAAAKIGDTEQANRILKAAEAKALQTTSHEPLRSTPFGGVASYEQLAWFYCFAAPDAGGALDWANKAYSTDPNSATAAAILAYSLVMNSQTDWAKLIIDNYEKNQIADLALAQIQLAEGQKDLAIETLKFAIAKDPGSLAAERAKEILARNGGEYIAPAAPDIILTVLENSFGRSVVPSFVSPDKIISVQLNVRGSEFSYGSEFGGTIAITNNSSEPLIVSDDGLFKGNIRIDANITGDLNKEIPNLVSVKIRPASPIAPGRSLLIPLRLVTGQLRQILFTYPQASLDIEFTAFIDPVPAGQGMPLYRMVQGKLTNRLAGIKLAKVFVKRPGIELTGRFLRNRFNSLTKGRQGQKINTARLFVGLLAEQDAMSNREPLYRFMYADWMPDLLKSALVHNLTDDDWAVKAHTMAAMLSLPLDYELTNALAENMNDTHWPARLMAVFLLAGNQDNNFVKVLDWTAKYDSSKLVRDMAIALGASVPEQPQPVPVAPEKTAEPAK